MRRLGAGLKFGAGPPDLREYYRLVAEYQAITTAGPEPDLSLRRRLAKLYHETRHYYA